MTRALLQRTSVLAALCLALTACGSTAQVTSSQPVGQGLGDPLSGPGVGPVLPGDEFAPPALGSTSGVGAGTGTDGRAGSAGTTASGSAGSGGSTPPGPQGPQAQRATGLGVTARTITVGIAYASNADAANAAIGAGAITSGDDLANSKALVDEINALGGIAGRKLVAVYHPFDAASSSPGSVQDQAACDAWTKDNKVIAAFSNNLTEVLPACLHKAGVAYVKSGVIVADDRVALRAHPLQFLLGSLTQERLLGDLVRTLVRQKYFAGWNTVSGQPGSAATKLAVLSYDRPSFTRAVNGTLLPALKSAGRPVTSGNVFFVSQPASQADVSGLTAQIKSATLRMQQDGVTHVIFNDASGLLLGLFATNANSQAYYPRFGLTSGAGPQGIYDAGLVQNNQMNGMSGIGWLPSLDLPAADGTKHQTAATRRCLEILKRRTGQTYTSTNAASIALGSCSGLFLFAQAMKLAPSLSPLGLAQGIEQVGSSFDSPFLPKAFFSRSQHDEGVRAWDLTWDSPCACVRYNTPHEIAP